MVYVAEKAKVNDAVNKMFTVTFYRMTKPVNCDFNKIAHNQRGNYHLLSLDRKQPWVRKMQGWGHVSTR